MDAILNWMKGILILFRWEGVSERETDERGGRGADRHHSSGKAASR